MQKDHIQLSEEDRVYLLDLTSSGSLNSRVFKRAMALLELDRGKTLRSVSDSLSEGFDHWTLRLLAEKVVELGFVEEISHTEVSRILKKTNSSLI